MTAVEQRWAPFRRFNMPLPRRERVKLAFGLVLLAPVRLLGVCLIATGFAVYATLVAATLGVGPGAHRAISVPGAACARAILWLCGFYSIRIVELPSREFGDRRESGRARGLRLTLRVREAPAPPDAPHADEPPSVIVANHLSYIDVFVLMACFGFPSFLAKEAIRDVPVVGRVCTVCRGLYVARVRHAEPHYYGEVARQVPDADAAAAGPAGGLTAALTARRGEVAAGRAPPVALFPEGTTTNGSAVIRFHTGAFVGGRPCALAMLRYPHRHFNPSWETFFFVPHLLELLCQWRNDVEVRCPPASACVFASHRRTRCASFASTPRRRPRRASPRSTRRMCAR
jgi:hypothetical protein